MKKHLFFIVLVLGCQVVCAQCDITLKPSQNSIVSYRQRGDRCEGAYSAKVSVPTLDIVGFTIGPFSYKLENSEIIEISNTNPSPIFIRAVAVPLNTYYRMDAHLKKNSTLKWQVRDVLLALNIPSEYVGVYGWTARQSKKVIIPLKVVTSTNNSSDNNFHLLIRPTSRVLAIKYRYKKSESDFQAYRDVDAPSRVGKPIVIVLPENLQGEYVIEVAAMLESKAGWVKNQYHLSIP